jgi:hypothetical protein
MEVQVDWLGIVVATVVAMAIGSIWYSKVLFGKTWQKLLGLKDDDMKKGAAVAMIKAVVMAFITAFVLSHMIYLSQAFYGYTFVQTGLTTAFWIWLGFVATQMIMNGAFEKRDTKLIMINVANQLVTLLAMGAVLGAFLG